VAARRVDEAEPMDDILLVRDCNRNLTIIIVEHEMGVIERSPIAYRAQFWLQDR
jgi:hypothetical protein